ncbi:hypothetical protein FA95DRAFT_1503793, partial [Auriscalpium vulgare]
MFDAVRTVFERNATLEDESLTSLQKAKKVIVQIVNNMNVRLEIGGPMASLYLLGHPDHYTMHLFAKLYWKNYINEVLRFCAIMDYTCRPKELIHMNVYDWIRTCTKTLKRKSRSKPGKVKADKRDADTESDSEFEDNDDKASVYTTDSDVEGLHLAEEDPDLNYTPNGSKQNKKPRQTQSYQFIPTHPQHGTHEVRVCKEDKSKVPNFLGGSLPRRDQGNIEEYCSTMLTLFKPWRVPQDLKDSGDTWQSTFESHGFSDNQRRVMDFMQIKYECNDARDDYAAKRKAGTAEGDMTGKIFNQIFEHLDQTIEDDGDTNGIDLTELAQALESQWQVIGKKTLNRLTQMTQIEKVMHETGWLE